METISFTLHLDHETLGRTAYGSIRGGVWCIAGQESFPCGKWRDRVAELLCRWLAAVNQLLEGKRPQASLSFLDGPYEVDLQPGADGLWQVSLYVHHYHGVEVRHRFTARGEEFVESLLGAAEFLLAEGDRRGWRHGDMDSVRLSVERLRGAIR